MSPAAFGLSWCTLQPRIRQPLPAASGSSARRSAGRRPWRSPSPPPRRRPRPRAPSASALRRRFDPERSAASAGGVAAGRRRVGRRRVVLTDPRPPRPSSCRRHFRSAHPLATLDPRGEGRSPAGPGCRATHRASHASLGPAGFHPYRGRACPPAAATRPPQPCPMSRWPPNRATPCDSGITDRRRTRPASAPRRAGSGVAPRPAPRGAPEARPLPAATSARRAYPVCAAAHGRGRG